MGFLYFVHKFVYESVFTSDGVLSVVGFIPFSGVQTVVYYLFLFVRYVTLY